MSKSTLSVAVIGAGLSGAVVANGLVEKGHTVRVFEKSRGVGGRLSTRRVRDEGEAKGVEFDHGAPAVHADGNAFRDFLESLDKGGAAAKWPDGSALYPGEQSACFVGIPAMNRLLHPLTDKLDIELQATVTSVAMEDGQVGVTYTDREGAEHSALFDRVVISAPAPQTVVIAAAFPEIAQPAALAKYHACWTVMLALNGKVKGRNALAPSANIEKVVCNTGKPQRDAIGSLTSYVAHTTSEWTEAHIDATREDVLRDLTPEILGALAVDDYMPSERDVAYAAAHRWLYALASKPVGKAFLETGDGKVFAIGDWCLGPNAEDAFMSAASCLRSMSV